MTTQTTDNSTATKTITANGRWHDPRQLPRMPKHTCGGFDRSHLATHAEAIELFASDDCPKLFTIGSAMIDGQLLPPMIGWISHIQGELGVIRKVTAIAWPRDVLINVNFPARPAAEVTGIEITREGRRKLGDEILAGRDPRGVPYYWIGNQKVSVTDAKGSDLAAIDEGKVSVTPLSMDLTHRSMMRQLKSLFAGPKSGIKSGSK